jgi:hypothetical protein
LAVVGFLAQRTRFARARIVALPFYFCLVNAAALLAAWKAAWGERIVVWQPQRAGSVGSITGGAHVVGP